MRHKKFVETPSFRLLQGHITDKKAHFLPKFSANFSISQPKQFKRKHFEPKVLFMSESVNLVSMEKNVDGDNYSGHYNSDGLDKSFIIQNELDLVPYYWGARTSQNIFVG